ncbi:hypothetical protein QZH41_015320 [Actinostola sp. cb2023]|nr:hypothetical protein QZH41_015320 [Actinostola sp. cb2023]
MTQRSLKSYDPLAYYVNKVGELDPKVVLAHQNKDQEKKRQLLTIGDKAQYDVFICVNSEWHGFVLLALSGQPNSGFYKDLLEDDPFKIPAQLLCTIYELRYDDSIQRMYKISRKMRMFKDIEKYTKKSYFIGRYTGVPIKALDFAALSAAPHRYEAILHDCVSFAMEYCDALLSYSTNGLEIEPKVHANINKASATGFSVERLSRQNFLSGMDRTVLFKASVKTIRTRNKALGVKDTDKGSTIFPTRSKLETEFGSRAKDVLVNIRKLRDFLMDHRKNYIDAASARLLSNDMSSMTDAERDQIDKDAETYMRTCNASIKALKNEVSKQAVPEQVKTHRDAVVELLEKYLKVVCKLYSEQRAIRVKRVVDKKRISRLQPENKKRQSDHQYSENEMGEEKSKLLNEDKQTALSVDNLEPPVDEDEELSPDEVQMFEQENKKLFEEMNSLVDEVRQIEGRVVEISRLQEIFSEKVLHQTHQIDRLYETSVGTTENVKSGNEQIREAIKNNASFRVWILFFLVMCSFSLLFLDWYS